MTPEEELRARVDAFLAAHSALTLATVDLQGLPAAAAVFYAHDENLDLYFLSEERTQHGQNMARQPQVAATIQADGQDWRAIQGLQVRGRAEPVPGGELARAATVYGRKYAFIAVQLAGGVGPGALAGPLARSKFYVLHPTWFRLIDNRQAFGFKQEMPWPG